MATRMLWIFVVLAAFVAIQATEEKHRRAVNSIGTVAKRFMDQLKVKSKDHRGLHLDTIKKLADTMQTTLKRRNLELAKSKRNEESDVAGKIQAHLQSTKRILDQHNAKLVAKREHGLHTPQREELGNVLNKVTGQIHAKREQLKKREMGHPAALANLKNSFKKVKTAMKKMMKK